VAVVAGLAAVVEGRVAGLVTIVVSFVLAIIRP